MLKNCKEIDKIKIKNIKILICPLCVILLLLEIYEQKEKEIIKGMLMF